MQKYDIFFISYRETNAEVNWQHLLRQAPYAKRIQGVTGIGQAYHQASKQAQTEHFYTVDGDNYVREDFDWEHIENLSSNREKVHVWRCQNPVNGLIYGYGGIKLWPKKLFTRPKENPPTDHYIDFTTEIAQRGYYIQEKIASRTHFNTSPLETWRSAFRECAKLQAQCIKKSDPKTRERLQIWMTVGKEKPFGLWALKGAQMGCEFGQHHRQTAMMEKINDFDYLENLFQRKMESL